MGKILKGRSILLIAVLAAFLVQGCANFKDIRIVSCRVESVSLKGLRGAEAALSVGVDNPAAPMTLSDITGRILLEDRSLGTFSAEPVSIEGRTMSECPVKVTFSLDNSISLMELVPMVRSLDMGSVTADVSLKVRVRKGVSKRVTLEKMPLSSFLKDSSALKDMGISDFFM